MNIHLFYPLSYLVKLRLREETKNEKQSVGRKILAGLQ